MKKIVFITILTILFPFCAMGMESNPGCGDADVDVEKNPVFPMTDGTPLIGASSSGSYYGCPSQYVCLYSADGALEHKYYYYGFNALYDEWGYHYIVNNQVDGALAFLCKNKNRSSCAGPIYVHDVWKYDMSPINYILLTER